MGNSNMDWFEKAKQVLLLQRKVICEVPNRKVPDKYYRYREVEDELEKLEQWRRFCSTSSSP